MRLDPKVKEKLKKAFSEEMAASHSVVRIVSSYPLSKENQDRILMQFPAYKNHIVENVVDKTILGGFIIQSGSQMVDLSIRSALHLLQKKLYESV